MEVEKSEGDTLHKFLLLFLLALDISQIPEKLRWEFNLETIKMCVEFFADFHLLGVFFLSHRSTNKTRICGASPTHH